MNRVNQIIVEHGVQAQLAQVFACTAAYVSQALRGKKTEGKAAKIRYVALSQYGGYEIDLITAQRKYERKTKSTPKKGNNK